MLANFFNSLLSSKKTSGSKSARATSRNEAAAEIERLQTKKSWPPVHVVWREGIIIMTVQRTGLFIKHAESTPAVNYSIIFFDVQLLCVLWDTQQQLLCFIMYLQSCKYLEWSISWIAGLLICLAISPDKLIADGNSLFLADKVEGLVSWLLSMLQCWKETLDIKRYREHFILVATST